MTAKDAFRVFKKLRVARTSEDQSGLYDVARVVDFSAVEISAVLLVAAVLDHPSKRIADLLQPIVVECLDVMKQ